MTLEAVLTAWTALDEGALSRPWTWQGGKMDVRYALYRTSEDAQEAVVRATATPRAEPLRIMALAQRAFGSLRGLVIGVPEALLDKEPRAGEWSVRAVLAHVANVEQRYAIQTAWAVERADADPMRVAAERLPALEASAGGGAAALLERIAEARAESNRRLGAIPPAAMTRPTVWVHYETDVRFRLHRFAAHIDEHTIQLEKTLAALGWRETEGRRIVRRIWAHVGELEALGATEELATLGRIVDERAASLGWCLPAPEGDGADEALGG